LANWITLVLQAKYADACMASAPTLPPGGDPQSKCAEPEVSKTLKALHDNWAKPNQVKLPPEGKVTVDQVQPTGNTATVSDAAVKVDGRTLHELMLIGAPDVSGQISFKLQRIDGAWYVAGFSAGT
jgi:hypothetical protein